MENSTFRKRLTIFVGMVLGTAVSGLRLGFGATFLLSFFLKKNIGGWGDLVGAVMGIVAGYPLGIIIGQVIIKKGFHFEGSLLLGVTGVILGVALVMLLAEPLHLNANSYVLFGTLFILTPLLGTFGYHLKGRNRKE
jgi:uncharacterized protein YacL